MSQIHRKEEETITKFVIALQAIVGNCAFGISLNECLRDQLVIGISNDLWQQELFRVHTTNDVMLQQVERTALILEQTSMQQQRAREMVCWEQITKINRGYITTRPQGGKRNTKTRCPRIKERFRLSEVWAPETSKGRTLLS